jgi:hypothetical protein
MNTTPTKHAPELIGATVETQLQDVADRLALGELELSACTPAIQALWMYAYDDGRKTHRNTCAGQIERLSWERDTYYWLVCNPGRKAADFYTHLTDALWAAAVTE